jgi:lipopolysaccharide transport system permease protein
MVGVSDGFRWAILGSATPMYWPGFAVSLGVTLFMLVTGIRYFRRTERSFADVI